jgi:hypothetical protein
MASSFEEAIFPLKVAIVAWMRKLLGCLNAMLRDNSPWPDHQVTALFNPA